MPSGGVRSAPMAPMPPALATAIERLAGHAPAMGARRIGNFRPYFAQNASARARGVGGMHSMIIRGFSWTVREAIRYTQSRTFHDRSGSLFFLREAKAWCARDDWPKRRTAVGADGNRGDGGVRDRV